MPSLLEADVETVSSKNTASAAAAAADDGDDDVTSAPLNCLSSLPSYSQVIATEQYKCLITTDTVGHAVQMSHD